MKPKRDQMKRLTRDFCPFYLHVVQTKDATHFDVYNGQLKRVARCQSEREAKEFAINRARSFLDVPRDYRDLHALRLRSFEGMMKGQEDEQ